MNVKDKEYEDRTKEERRLRMEAKNEAIRKEDMFIVVRLLMAEEHEKR